MISLQLLSYVKLKKFKRFPFYEKSMKSSFPVLIYDAYVQDYLSFLNYTTPPRKPIIVFAGISYFVNTPNPLFSSINLM